MFMYIMSQCLNTQSTRNTQVPLIRFNLSNPYRDPITGESTGITPQQLDMRRKAEILKYSSNRMPTQTNSLTKKQKWSRLIGQTTSRARQYAAECLPDPSVLTPSSSSGVPGPAILLYEDPSVPLYNYIITRSYAYNIPNPNGFWDVVVNTNVVLLERTGSGIFTLNILPNINRPTYTYFISTPIALHVQGKFRPGTLRPNVKINIKTATLFVYCNGKNMPELTKTIDGLNTLQLVFKQTNPNVQPFNITQIAGDLNIPSIALKMSPIYSFDFAISVIFEIFIDNVLLTDQNSPFESLQYNAYANVTSVVPIVNTNCTIIFPTEPINNTEPGFFGL